MKKLVLIRGVPGSGKSTLAKNEYIPKGYVHFEADMYFMVDGIYKFDRTQIGNAHQWCQTSTYGALAEGKNVVVSNTFTTINEMKPYIDMANNLKINYLIIEATGNYVNEHNVPDYVIAKMKQRWEKIS